MTRRGRSTPGIVVIWWRDIPAQVTATGSDGAKEQILLDHRFQVAIDKAAAVAGLTTTDDYVNEWRRQSISPEGDPVEAARAEANRLDQHFGPDRLNYLIRSGGIDSDSPFETQHPNQEDQP